MQSFADSYCARNNLPAEKFEEAVFVRCLYFQARMVWRLFNWFDANYFAADRDFVRSVGQLKRMRDFGSEVSEFAYHPANRGFLRRGLRFRLSSAKLRALVESYLHGVDSTPPVENSGTAAPFGS